MIGIVEEQHPDRTRLFMQWKQMSWPVLVDSLNLFEVTAVPITVLIDEGGTVRGIRPSEEDFDRFLAAEPVSNRNQPSSHASSPVNLPEWPGDDHLAALHDYGNAYFLWDKESGLQEAIRAYQRILELDPNEAVAHFRLGVCYRALFEHTAEPEDFKLAIQHWSAALEIDPNQYIWRRRIQQWGPRLDKPYSFYDWVKQARRDISSRGEVPLQLAVEPSGAELAFPAEEMAPERVVDPEPDPGGRIWRDAGQLIRIDTVVVPMTTRQRKAYRIHLMMSPAREKKAHWNNEAGNLTVWVDAPEGWVASPLLTLPVPHEPVSQELRNIEFEIVVSDGFSGSQAVPAYALYYVCEDVQGTCLYRRQDFTITVN